MSVTVLTAETVIEELDEGENRRRGPLRADLTDLTIKQWSFATACTMAGKQPETTQQVQIWDASPDDDGGLLISTES